MIATLRVVHGIAVSLGILLSTVFLAGTLSFIFQGEPLQRTPSYLVLYTGSLMIQLFIAWGAWRRFEKCSVRTSLISYGVWMVFFVWHGWFTEWAPFRLHELLVPADTRKDHALMCLGHIVGGQLLHFFLLCVTSKGSLALGNSGNSGRGNSGRYTQTRLFRCREKRPFAGHARPQDYRYAYRDAGRGGRGWRLQKGTSEKGDSLK